MLAVATSSVCCEDLVRVAGFRFGDTATATGGAGLLEGTVWLTKMKIKNKKDSILGADVVSVNRRIPSAVGFRYKVSDFTIDAGKEMHLWNPRGKNPKERQWGNSGQDGVLIGYNLQNELSYREWTWSGVTGWYLLGFEWGYSLGVLKKKTRTSGIRDLKKIAKNMLDLRGAKRCRIELRLRSEKRRCPLSKRGSERGLN